MTGLTERDRQPSRACRRIAILSARLSAPPPLLAEAHLFGEARASGRIIRGHHRIIWRQAPLLSILLRCQVVTRPQMTLKRLEFFPVFEADEMLRRDRLLDRNRGFARLASRLALAPHDSGQRAIHLTDQCG